MVDTPSSPPFGSVASSTQPMRDAALLRATTELFLQDETHSPDEVRRYEELAAHLLPRVAEADRAMLAERLAGRADAPQAVVRLLARDTIAVATPVLRASPVLAALDLLSVIAATGPEHHRVIADRPALPYAVQEALRISAERGRPPAEARRDADDAGHGPPPGRSRPAAMPAAALPFRPPPPRPQRRPPSGWHFLRLARPERLRAMAELASEAPGRAQEGTGRRIDRAFRAILGAAQIVGLARRGDREALVEAVAASLELPADLVRAALADATGEPFAVLLKSLGLDNVQAQQVFLLAMPRVGRDTEAFFRLCDLYAGLERSVAERLAEGWRAGAAARHPQHVPHLAENGPRARPNAADAVRPMRPAATERKARGAGEPG